MSNEWTIILAIIGLWIPVTLALVNIAHKFGVMVNSVEQMKTQVTMDSGTLCDLLIRVTKLEVRIDGKTQE
jgi:hypothetical protein